MNEKCIPLNKSCVAHTAEPLRTASTPFTLCVGTSSLVWDGQVLSVNKGTPIEDGEYTSFTVRDGCIVGAGQAPVPEYTPPPCAEPPVPCGGGGGSSEVSPQAGNLTTATLSGLYTGISIEEGVGITVDGTGTTGDPLIISAEASSGPTLVATTTEISISTPAPGTIGIGLQPSGISAGTYAGITFNSRGIATGYTAPSASGLTGVTGVGEVGVEVTSGVAAVSLKAVEPGNSTFNVGAYSMKLSQGGTVTTMTQITTIPAGTYTLGAYNVTFNAYGIPTTVDRSINIPAGSFETADGKTVSYDQFGAITGVS